MRKVDEKMNVLLTPYLMSEDARTQAEFYIQALGGEVISVMTHAHTPGIPEAFKDKVMHLAMSVAGGNTLFMSDSFEPVAGSRSLSLSLSFESEAEAKGAFAKLSEGGVVKYPLEKQPWGASYGELQDKFGVTWMIVNETR
ncbi:VOC family protein [Paenibacillus sp. YIM B09110]|uniref:VOC family protein n=1 Tax=Paenibacillus sp. YIM B09110 TaxID=3126102 RepID=UPI00301E48D4